ncbi:MAG: S8 family serine peptidase [Anaerolineales bacterium]|nr:S8 family serine peptidase [Anaerolineales bacterium]
MFQKSQAIIVLAFIALFWLFAAVPDTQPMPIRNVSYHKVLGPPNWMVAQREDVQLWHDYGAFALYAVSPTAVSQLRLADNEAVQIMDTWDILWVGSTPLNTQAAAAAQPSADQEAATNGYALQLIQFVGPIKQEWLTAVSATGATLIHYVANNGYLVWADDAGRAKLVEMSHTSDFLQYSGPYQEVYKIESTLQALDSAAVADELVTISVQMIRHTQQGSTEQAIQALSAQSQIMWTPILAYQNTAVTVHASDIATIAALPDVVWVGAYHSPEMLDEVQAQLLAGAFNNDQTGPTAPGYLTWLNDLGFSQNPVDYPIIDIVDDGVGSGQIDSGDYTLNQFGGIDAPSRVAYNTNCTSDVAGGGIHGHGHLNASIAVGYDTQTGGPYQDENGYQRGLGINPYGRVADTRVFNNAGFFDVTGCQRSVVEIARRTSANGAAISSNSWGCSLCAGVYDLFSQAYDTAVRDAQRQVPGNQEVITIFAAGNAGPGSTTILSPGNGKNVISVGGSESFRTDFAGLCVPSNYVDNAMDIAAFSSRGPAAGGRVKPEIVAPATHIVGTASPHPDFNASAVCAYYPNGQDTFVTSSGTSHAAPAVSGIASLYYYWLENEYGLTPSPAMMKAYLIAHPAYLTGVDANDTLPSNDQGYGMPNMAIAFDDADRHLVDQTIIFDNSGETWTFDTSVADPTKPVRLVMTYTDQPGMVGISPQVNDLSLKMTMGGQTYRGNHFSGQWSSPGGAPDALNNYEAIFLPAGTSGSFSVTVTAHNVAGNGVPGVGDETDQDFAFVCYNCVQTPDFEITIVPADQSTCQTTNDMNLNVSTRKLAGFSEQVVLSVQGLPAGVNVVINPSTIVPGSSSVITMSGLSNAAAGDYKLTVTGMAVSQTHSNHFWLHVSDALPSPVTLSEPPDQATDVVVNPLFTWSSPTTEFVTLQVATDAAFTDIVYDTVVQGQSHRYDSLLNNLDRDTHHYWRVLSENSCGQTVSLTQEFHTDDTFSILLVDDDWGMIMSLIGWGQQVETAFVTAMNHQGSYFGYWDVESMGGEEPGLETLSNYDAVIWFSGDTYFPFGSAGPNEQSETALTSFLEQDRCLLISSQEYARDSGVSAFMQTYLGVSSAEDDAGATLLTGQPIIFDALGTFPIGGTPELFIADPDIVRPNASAEVAFVREDQAPVAVYRDAGYQTVFLGFDLSDVGQMERMLILDTFLDWCRATEEYRLPQAPNLPDLFLPIVIKP